MKLIVHDYSGHPFQAQLSRELARRGHEIKHVQCGSYVSGKGNVQRKPTDPSSLSFTDLGLGSSFSKYAPLRRVVQELRYARTFNRLVSSYGPDLIVMCNVPLVAHWLISRRLDARRLPQVFWHQDVYSHAIRVEAKRRFRSAGSAMGRLAGRLERQVAQTASAVVAISNQFVAVHEQWGIDRDKVSVIPNWAPLDDVAPLPKANDWAKAHDLADKPVLLYSGTLGLKHDTEQLVGLLRGVRRDVPNAQLVVVSEGPAADSFRDSQEPGVTVLPFQPFASMSAVFSSADLLIAILRPEAGTYSVPSKALTYLCAGRPVVGLLPATNPAFQVIQESGGLALDLVHTDMSDASNAVAGLLSSPEELARRGRQAREWAEEHFDIKQIGDAFEKVVIAAHSSYSRDMPRKATDPHSRSEATEVRSA